MNLVSSPTPNPPSESMLRSLQTWWALAGVDLDYADEPAALLTPESSISPTMVPPPPPVAKPVQTGAIPAVGDESLPVAYEDFLEWLANGSEMIEASWGKNRILPQGDLQPEVMTVSALPEKGSDGKVRLFNSDNRLLLNRMLAAIGCESERAYIATIAVTPSIDGRIDEQYWSVLKTRLLHHIGLVRPKRLICFGDLAAKIIFGENLLSARKNRQFINHGSSRTEAIVTFHPRILIERPLFKAEAWKDLQMLTRISVP